MTWRVPFGSSRACLVIVIVLVLLRAFVFVWWADPHFDADQAVTGLQARHLAEGRAFPVFQYAQQYVVVLESWLAAPFVAIAPTSPTAVKIVPVLLNVAAVVLLYLTLVSAARLAPWMALLATMPLALPGPRTAKDLVDALGMNIEPFVFALLIWRWRARPIALGITAALGVKNREFTMYAVAALIAVDLLRELAARTGRWSRVRPEPRPEPPPSAPVAAARSDVAAGSADAAPFADAALSEDAGRSRRTASARAVATAVTGAPLWRGRVAAVVAFALTSTAVDLLTQVSSPFGPGTTVAILAEGKGNVGVASSAMCIVPALMPGDVAVVLTRLLPLQLGVGNEALIDRQLFATPIDYSAAWPLLAALLLAGIARGLWRAWRHGPSEATWIALFLLLVGAQAVTVYALTRCGHAAVGTLRYTLLALLLPAGAIVLAIERESRASVRRVVVGGVAAWMAICAVAHVRVLRAHVAEPPRGAYRELARYLEQQGIQFIVTDYWTGYHVAFLTGERVKPLTNFERIREYTLAVSAHPEQAVEVRRLSDAPCGDAVVASAFYVCRPTRSAPPPP